MEIQHDKSQMPCAFRHQFLSLLSALGLLALAGCGINESPTSTDGNAPEKSATGTGTSRNQVAELTRRKSSTRLSAAEAPSTASRFTTPTLTVRGEAITIEGVPVAGALVRVFSRSVPPGYFSGSDHATTITGIDGYFEMRVPAEKDLVVEAAEGERRSEAHSVTDSSDIEQRAKERRNWDFEKTLLLQRTTTLAGQVLLPNGMPAVGAAVHAYPLMEPAGVHRWRETSVTSSLDGSFLLPDLLPGRFYVVGKLPGYARAAIEVPSGSQELVLHLKRPASVSGRAIDAVTDQPIPDISLTLSDIDTHVAEKVRSRTLRNGEFIFDGLPGGKYAVIVEGGPAGILEPAAESRKLLVQEGETTEGVILRFSRAPEMRGIVVDSETSQPLAGVRYHAASPGSNTVQTTASGEFVVTCRGPNCFFSGSKPGFAPVYKRLFSGRPQTTHTVEMRRLVPLTGRVVSHARGPLPDALVRLRGKSSDQTEYRTGPQGEFTFFCASNTFVELEASAVGHALAVSPEIIVPQGGGAVPDIVLHEGITVMGKILDETSGPVQGASVTAHVRLPDATKEPIQIAILGGEAARVETTNVSNAAGEFEIRNLPVGQVTLEAKKPGYMGVPLDVGTTSSQNELRVELSLERNRPLLGRVLNAETSQPVAGAPVAVRDPHRDNRHASATTDLEGRFRLELAPAEKLRFFIRQAEYESLNREVEVDFDREVELLLSPEQTYEFLGEVVDSATRQPLENFTVELDFHEKAAAGVSSEVLGAGRFRIPGVRRGTSGNLVVHAPGYGASHYLFGRSGNGDKQVRETFLMYPMVEVRGRLISAKDHKPITGMKVAIAPIGSRLKESEPTMTGDDGRFVARVGGGRGRYGVLFVRHPSADTQLVRRKITIPDNPAPDIGDIEIGATARIFGRVLSGSNRVPVQGSSVMLRVGTDELKTMTEASGHFNFPDIPVDIHQESLTLRLPDRGISRSIRQLSAGEERELNMYVNGTTLRGKILRNNVPLEGRLHASQDSAPAGTNVNRAADKNGTYLLKDLGPGKWTLWVMPKNERSRYYRREVTLPDQPVFEYDVHLPVGSIRGTVYDPTGVPFKPNSVSVSQLKSDGSVDRHLMPTVQEDGTYELAGVEAGTYGIVARSQKYGSMSARCTVRENQDVRVDIRYPAETATLVSYAYDYVTGEGLVNARLYVTSRDTGALISSGNVRDPYGRMELEKLAPGTYDVRVSHDGYRSAKHTVELKAGETRELQDVLQRAGGFEWSLKQSDGSPAAGIPVKLTCQDPGCLQDPVNGVTDSHGNWTEGEVLPGRYRLETTGHGIAVSTEIEIRGNETARASSIIP